MKSIQIKTISIDWAGDERLGRVYGFVQNELLFVIRTPSKEEVDKLARFAVHSLADDVVFNPTNVFSEAVEAAKGHLFDHLLHKSITPKYWRIAPCQKMLE